MYCVSILIICLGLSSRSSCETTDWLCGSFQPPTCCEGKPSPQSNVPLPSNYFPPSQQGPSIISNNSIVPPHQNSALQSQVPPSLNVLGPSSTEAPLIVPAPAKSNQPVTSSTTNTTANKSPESPADRNVPPTPNTPLASPISDFNKTITASPPNAPLIVPAILRSNASRAVSQFPFTSTAVPVIVNPNTTATSPSITSSRAEPTQIFDKSTHASNISGKENLESKTKLAASPSMLGTARNAALSETPATKTMRTNRLLFTFH